MRIQLQGILLNVDINIFGDKKVKYKTDRSIYRCAKSTRISTRTTTAIKDQNMCNESEAQFLHAVCVESRNEGRSCENAIAFTFHSVNSTEI